MRPDSANASTGYAPSAGKPNPTRENTSTREACKWQCLHIAVFKGDPIDEPHYRHTGLFIEHLAEDGTVLWRWFLHVTGASGFFEREERERNPRASALFVGLVTVATIPVTGASDRRLRDAIWSTPVDNIDRSWNCQNYVGDALEACVRAGLISRGQADHGIDGMTDLILEACDAGLARLF